MEVLEKTRAHQSRDEVSKTSTSVIRFGSSLPSNFGCISSLNDFLKQRRTNADATSEGCRRETEGKNAFKSTFDSLDGSLYHHIEEHRRFKICVIVGTIELMYKCLSAENFRAREVRNPIAFQSMPNLSHSGFSTAYRHVSRRMRHVYNTWQRCEMPHIEFHLNDSFMDTLKI